MKYVLDDLVLDVVITRKNNKNTYIRLKDANTIYVTTSYFATNNSIKKLLDENKKFIISSIDKINNKKMKDENFYYLGKKYEIAIIPTVDEVLLSDDSIIVKNELQLDKWLKKQMIQIFSDRYNYLHSILEEKLEKPTLKIRYMKTRWGVCNKRNMTITLNSELIKYDIKCLDYVIIHELSHLVYFDHSPDFWKQVSKYVPDYKEIRKQLKN